MEILEARRKKVQNFDRREEVRVQAKSIHQNVRQKCPIKRQEGVCQFVIRAVCHSDCVNH